MLNKTLVVLSFLCSFSAISGETSKLNTIGLVQFDANAKKIYVKPASGSWTDTGCHTVLVTSSMQGQDGFLSVALAAKFAEKKVSFFGDCDLNTKLFMAHSIYVH